MDLKVNKFYDNTNLIHTIHACIPLSEIIQLNQGEIQYQIFYGERTDIMHLQKVLYPYYFSIILEKEVGLIWKLNILSWMCFLITYCSITPAKVLAIIYRLSPDGAEYSISGNNIGIINIIIFRNFREVANPRIPSHSVLRSWRVDAATCSMCLVKLVQFLSSLMSQRTRLAWCPPNLV